MTTSKNHYRYPETPADLQVGCSLIVTACSPASHLPSSLENTRQYLPASFTVISLHISLPSYLESFLLSSHDLWFMKCMILSQLEEFLKIWLEIYITLFVGWCWWDCGVICTQRLKVMVSVTVCSLENSFSINIKTCDFCKHYQKCPFRIPLQYFDILKSVPVFLESVVIYFWSIASWVSQGDQSLQSPFAPRRWFA